MWLTKSSFSNNTFIGKLLKLIVRIIRKREGHHNVGSPIIVLGTLELSFRSSIHKHNKDETSSIQFFQFKDDSRKFFFCNFESYHDFSKYYINWFIVLLSGQICLRALEIIKAFKKWRKLYKNIRSFKTQ